MVSHKEPSSGGLGAPWPAVVAIVEDNAEIAQLYVLLIEARGMRVGFVARDGDEAVRAFRGEDDVPDVVLIDHRMPVRSGLEAMKEMRALRPAARFVFVSADEHVKEEALAAGADAFLAKPVSLRLIADTIEKVMRPDRKG